MSDQEWTPCHVCGVRRDVGAPSDGQWLWVEVERLHAPGYWQAVFCSEEHAAHWFGPPMPSPDFVAAEPRPEPAWRTALAYLGCSVSVLGVAGFIVLAVIGAVSLLT